MNAQIWVGRVTKRSSVASSKVVLKLVQPSLRPIPQEDSETEYTYSMPEYAARCEAEFYEKAKHLQGRTIPHFFGIQELLPFKFKTL